MATLTGTKPKDTYKDLLQVSNSNSGIDATLRTVSDGEATNSTLQLSTTTINLGGTVQLGGTTLTPTGTELNYIKNVTSSVQTQLNAKAVSGGAEHDNFSDFVANEHIDWTSDQGATNIHSGNYTNTTYTAGDFNHDDLANITGTAAQYNHPTDAQMTVLGNTSGTNTGDQTNITGNAATATALETARTIGGVSFDGTANITVASATNNFAITGDLNTTGARVTKGWFTDLEVTNAIAGSITGNAATVSTIAGLAPNTATTQATQPNITSLGTLTSLGITGDLTVDTNTLFVDASTDRVGIGTASPVFKLHLKVGDYGGTASANSGMLIEHSGSVYLQFLVPSTKKAGLYFGDEYGQYAGSILYDNTTDDMTLDTGGSGNIDMTPAGGLVDVTGSVVTNSNYVLEGGTSRGVLRSMELRIQDGTNANTVKVVTGAVTNFNCSTFTVDNVALGATTGNITLPAGGSTMTLLNALLDGNVVDVLSASVVYNRTGSSMYCRAYESGGGIHISFDNGTAGVNCTTAVDTGDFYIQIEYLTST